MAYTGINFRATAGYVTDGAGETYCVGEAYPTTRGGLTFGFGSAKTSDGRDRNNTVDRRLAGMVQQNNAAGTADFRLDLPNGAGTYNVRLALGDHSFGQNHRCLIIDGSGGSTLATIDVNTPGAQNWLDAQGTVHFSATGWVNENVVRELTFTSSHMILRIGGDASGTSSTTIAHVAIDEVAPPAGSRIGAGLTSPLLLQSRLRRGLVR